MGEQFDIQEYMTKGVETIVEGAIRSTLKNPRESAFMLRFAAASKKASKKRAEEEKAGIHVPPFIIASITSSCNLNCAGCYSRHNHATVDAKPVRQLRSEEWLDIFDQAEDIGVSFILLAGGEPMIRRDIIKAAGNKPNILFPIFTNGTFMDDDYFELFDKSRNLIPVMSIEGDRETTDKRRGAGVYDKLVSNMSLLQEKGLIFGASVTVTKDNIEEVTGEEFIDSLAEKGCKLVIYVEFVPVDDEASNLAPDDADREFLKERISVLRKEYEETVFVSFPGDEKSSGGCIAAGRGFFHINSHGDAEPCPFSPYSDINVRDTSLLEAIDSKLFASLRDGGYLKEDHAGGCVLFEKRELVEKLSDSRNYA